MHNFPTLLLRSYYGAIGWNEDNLYSNLTRSSSAILDFTVPTSLALQLANAPTPIFFTSYSLDALPQLNGSLSYITTSRPVSSVADSLASNRIPLKQATEHFRVHPSPRRPSAPEEEWLAGNLVKIPRDYLLYSRLHLPSLHLSALATTKITSTLQGHFAFLHRPALGIHAPSSSSSSATNSGSSSTPSPREPRVMLPPPPPGNLMLSLQHDTGRWSSEYTYSATDGMFGIRSLYNFGLSDVSLGIATPGVKARQTTRLDDDALARPEVLPEVTLVSSNETAPPVQRWDVESKRVDEEEAMEGGLRGRFSAGGEVYFSAKQRSFGVSTGVRFTTIPPASPSSSSTTPSPLVTSPPTTLTLLYNPLIGFISSAYSAQISPHLALSSRFGVNVYSYESDLSLGGEWWIGSGRGKGGFRGLGARPRTSASTPSSFPSKARETADPVPLISSDAGGSDITRRHTDKGMERFGRLVDNAINTQAPVVRTDGNMSRGDARDMGDGVEGIFVGMPAGSNERDGVLRARLSGDGLISLLYEARIRKCLVSMGVSTDLWSTSSSPSRSTSPIRGLGMEIQYFGGD